MFPYIVYQEIVTAGLIIHYLPEPSMETQLSRSSTMTLTVMVTGFISKGSVNRICPCIAGFSRNKMKKSKNNKNKNCHCRIIPNVIYLAINYSFFC
jgi:hypothetical protein